MRRKIDVTSTLLCDAELVREVDAMVSEIGDEAVEALVSRFRRRERELRNQRGCDPQRGMALVTPEYVWAVVRSRKWRLR
jgi:hypothetical protein